MIQYIRLSEINIEEHIGSRIFVTFLARDISIKTQRDNINRYLNINMVDKDTVVPAKKFSLSKIEESMLKDGKVYNAAIDVQRYDKASCGYSCVIYNIDISAEDSKDFVSWGKNIEVYRALLEGYLNDIIETDYGKITYEILKNNWEEFNYWSAAQNIHHTRLGELLIHTVEVTAICIALADYYNGIYGEQFINKSLLMAASILHDVGKIYEYDVSIDTGITKKSTHSVLSTHIIDIVTEVELTAYKLGIGRQFDIEDEEENKDDEDIQLEKEEIDLLKHCLAAHHKKLEYGSPIEPSIPEASLLHSADEISAQMYVFDKAFNSMEPGESFSRWIGTGYTMFYKETSKKYDI